MNIGSVQRRIYRYVTSVFDCELYTPDVGVTETQKRY
jgi:hypothetical protein